MRTLAADKTNTSVCGLNPTAILNYIQFSHCVLNDCGLDWIDSIIADCLNDSKCLGECGKKPTRQTAAHRSRVENSAAAKDRTVCMDEQRGART